MGSPVTGPNGGNPITDEQIRQLEAEADSLTGWDEALNNPDARPPRPCPARDRLARAWNARHGCTP